MFSKPSCRRHLRNFNWFLAQETFLFPFSLKLRCSHFKHPSVELRFYCLKFPIQTIVFKRFLLVFLFPFNTNLLITAFIFPFSTQSISFSFGLSSFVYVCLISNWYLLCHSPFTYHLIPCSRSFHRRYFRTRGSVRQTSDHFAVLSHLIPVRIFDGKSRWKLSGDR